MTYNKAAVGSFLAGLLGDLAEAGDLPWPSLPNRGEIQSGKSVDLKF